MSEMPALPPLVDAPVSVLLIAAAAVEFDEVVASWREALIGFKRSFEILVVGSESDPALAALREGTGFQDAECRLILHADPAGDGPAVRAGLQAARHPLLLVAPGDKQYHPRDAEPFLSLINDVHLVCGYRVWRPLPGWMAALDWMKRALSRLLLGYLPPPRQFWVGCGGWGRRWLGRWIFGLRLQDVECGLRLFRKEILERFPIQARGAFAHIEVLAKANHLGCMMAEAPVSWVPPKVEARDQRFAADAMLVFRRPEFRMAPRSAEVGPQGWSAAPAPSPPASDVSAQ